MDSPCPSVEDPMWDTLGFGIFAPKTPLSPLPRTPPHDSPADCKSSLVPTDSPHRSENLVSAIPDAPIDSTLPKNSPISCQPPPPKRPVKRSGSSQKSIHMSPKKLFVFAENEKETEDGCASSSEDETRTWLPSHKKEPSVDFKSDVLEKKKRNAVSSSRSEPHESHSKKKESCETNRMQDSSYGRGATEGDRFHTQNTRRWSNWNGRYHFSRHQNLSHHRVERQVDPFDQYPVHHRKDGQPPMRQVFSHLHGMAVLVIQESNYTLTNGITSISVDEANNWEYQLVQDIQAMNVKRLFVVGEETRLAWRELTRKEPRVATLKEVLMAELAYLGNCMFCHKTCHRWKAIGGGIQRLYQFPIDAIRH